MEFLPQLMLRCPVYAFRDYAPEKLGEVLRDPFFQAALYLASQGLWEVTAKKDFEIGSLKEKERLSLLRYYNRMSFRPTPFGCFASFTMTTWGKNTELRLTGKKLGVLHLEVDQDLGLHLSDALRGRDLTGVSFLRHPLSYTLGKERRFIKTLYEKKPEFELEALPRSALTDRLFDNEVRKGTEITALIREAAGCDQEAAIDYLRFLVDTELLLPLTAPNIIGEDYLRRLLKHPEVPDSSLKIKLSALLAKAVSLAEITELGAELKTLLPGYKAGTYYAGMERKIHSGSLSLTYQPVIRDGFNTLKKLVAPVPPTLLVQFIRDFKARFDRQKVPLLLALDPDAGIGYGALTAAVTDETLLRDVIFSTVDEQDSKVPWSAVHRLLLRKWHNGYDPICLTEEDLQMLPDQGVKLPPSLPVLFRIAQEGIYLESVGGASATALIGRFTSWSREAHELGMEITREEQSANPGVLFAELGQRSDAHTDNINRRAGVYDYEIPVNTVSTLPQEQQIALSDLWLSVAGEELVLESRSLNKIVIPRLSSAYNYSRNSLAVFRLLCDLQYQGIQGNFSFSLEDFFPGMRFYPRVVYRQAILSLATWHLTSNELKQLQGNWDLVRSSLRLPAVVALSKADQQLVFRLDEAADVAFLLDCLKGLDHAVLQEYLVPAQAVKAGGDKVLVNQFIAFLAHKGRVYTAVPAENNPSYGHLQTAYGLGSQWLYLKLYVNPAMANNLLTKKVMPLLQQLDWISWFFIRYEDNGYHIRLRLRVKESALGSLLKRIKRRLATEPVLREYQAATYYRELERYGADIMEKVEEFFYGSSALVMAYLKVSGSKPFPYTYHSLAFISVNDMLTHFFPDEGDQLAFLKQITHAYNEFATNKVQLDQKYRELKVEIGQLLQDKRYYSRLKLDEPVRLFTEKMNHLLKATTGFTRTRRTGLLADLIHMHLNRIFADRQREQELILYFCLYKHALSVTARP
ncbi:lantibiotic dehydratase [Mucilaginibacter calamicampi]|uniref:Lantibiotic dehydratase n=1 Tax=Mucilaginibacter calamicampi TaxID=1302352 RepID=A0ABW2YU33_9SPHI